MEIETAKKTGNGENLGNRRYLLLFRISSDNFAQVDYPGIYIYILISKVSSDRGQVSLEQVPNRQLSGTST